MDVESKGVEKLNILPLKTNFWMGKEVRNSGRDWRDTGEDCIMRSFITSTFQ
jgi:hypothetical protein